MKKNKPTKEELQEEKQANKAFNFIVAFGKRKKALVSIEEIPKQDIQLKLFNQKNIQNEKRN